MINRIPEESTSFEFKKFSIIKIYFHETLDIPSRSYLNLFHTNVKAH